jgi:hypothetical protein
MDVRRLRAGELMAATGGVALFVSLFLPWYQERRVFPGLGAARYPDRTAWDALAVNDVILALVALAALALLLVTAAQEVPAVPIAMNSLVTLFGLIGLVLLLVRVAWLPDGADQRAWGLWVGLAGAAAIVVGGWIAMRDQRVSPSGKWTDSSGRPSARPPDVEITTLPAPRGSE